MSAQELDSMRFFTANFIILYAKLYLTEPTTTLVASGIHLHADPGLVHLKTQWECE